MTTTPKDVFLRRQAKEAKYLIDQWVPAQISLHHSQNIAEQVVRSTNRVFYMEDLIAVPKESLREVKEQIEEISNRPGADLYTLTCLTRVLNLVKKMERNSFI